MSFERKEREKDDEKERACVWEEEETWGLLATLVDSDADAATHMDRHRRIGNVRNDRRKLVSSLSARQVVAVVVRAACHLKRSYRSTCCCCCLSSSEQFEKVEKRSAAAAVVGTGRTSRPMSPAMWRWSA